MLKENRLFKITCLIYALVLLITVVAVVNTDFSMYANKDNWAIIDDSKPNAKADVFFIAPTVFLGSESNLYWSVFDTATLESFVGATNMEKGIYDDMANFYAPLYHQASLSAYYVDNSEIVFDNAFNEIRQAFEYYLKHYNGGKPFIIAGFSQGAQHAIRLVKEYAGNTEFENNLIACYAIGWRITQEELNENANIKFATGETDTGVIIAFNSEDPSIKSSLLIPEGCKTVAINPLNWKTTEETADKELNLGACFTDYSGNITKEIPEFTGAYIDPVRGALKVTDVDIDEYPGVLFDNGIYHIYDYQFFYRNLEKNVQNRINAFIN